MEILGLQKLSLVDYPGKTAATLFTGGCNFRCPFCHNAGLVANPDRDAAIPIEQVMRYLEKRVGLLDGVCITGGEPLLHAQTEDLIKQIRQLGYAVKLDTNGSFPDRLERILTQGLVDYVAMDIKNSPQKYPLTAGAELDVDKIRASAALLMSGSCDFEFRTTAVKQLHNIADFDAIGMWLAGDEKYYIQCFSDAGNVLQEGYSAPSREDLEQFAAVLRRYIPKVTLRGV